MTRSFTPAAIAPGYRVPIYNYMEKPKGGSVATPEGVAPTESAKYSKSLTHIGLIMIQI
jgi:hypothetical protein